jgi:hypothetical protein
MTNNLDNIFDFIKENRKDIFAFVENNKYISSFDEYIAHNNENIFDKLVINLIANFPFVIVIQLIHRTENMIKYILNSLKLFWKSFGVYVFLR